MPVFRWLSEKTLARVIKQNQRLKILVILHLYYYQSWASIRQYLLNLRSYSFSLMITYVGNIPNDILESIKSEYPDVQFCFTNNSGYDIYPFYVAIKNIDLNLYDVILKIHSKGVKRKHLYMYGNYFGKRDWFNLLFDSILGPFNIHYCLNKFITDPDTGIVCAKKLLVTDPKHKQNLVQLVLNKYNIPIKKNYRFVAGSCFAIRSSALSNFQNLELEESDFLDRSVSMLSLAHALERFVCYNIEDLGFKFQTNENYYLTDPWCYILSLPYKHYSSFPLLNDTRFSIDDEHFYRALETKLIKRYDVIRVPLSSLKRRWYDGKTYNLNECSPYLYLCGDTERYMQYCYYHQIHKLPFMSLDRYNQLIDSINKYGYDKKSMIIVKERNIITDGQHRACVLLYKYGPEHAIDVLKIWFKKESLLKSICKFIKRTGKFIYKRICKYITIINPSRFKNRIKFIFTHRLN